MLIARMDSRQRMNILPIALIPFMNMILTSSGNMINILQSFSGFLQLLIPLFLIEYVRKGNYRLGRYVLMYFLLSSFITTITTYFGCMQYPGIIREIVGGGSSENTLYKISQSLNIGGFDFIYDMVLLLPLLICSIKYRDCYQTPFRVLAMSCIFVVVIGMMLIAAEFTTAILSATISVVLLLVMNKQLDTKKMFVWGGIFILVAYALMPLIVQLLNYFASSIESGTISHRLSDLAASLSGSETSQGSDIDERQEAFTTSWNTFIANPLGAWGVARIGGHSFLLDNLARYGIWGIFMFYLLFRSIVRNYILPFKTYTYHGYAIFVFVLSCIFSLVNPHIYLDMICLYMPLFLFTLEQRYTSKL